MDISDDGTCSDTSDSVDQAPSRHIPTDLPPWLTASRCRRPDFTIVMGPTGPEGPGPTSVKLVEIKFGQDTTLESKLPDATSILDSMALSITARWPKCVVTSVVLTIGVGGRIPSSILPSLLDLGLPRHAASSLCNKLNILAVAWLHRIVQTRRRLEHCPAPA